MAKKMFQCEGCDELHEYYSRAEECCRPEVLDVYVCNICCESYISEDEADRCCAGIEVFDHCPLCYRDHGAFSINQAAIVIAGHCQICNPHFTYEQQFAIEDLHFERTQRHERLNA